MRPSISEIYAMVGEAKKRSEKIDILRQNDHVGLRKMLGLALDKRVEWEFPKDWKPEYKPQREINTVEAVGMLYNEIRTFYLFVKPGNPIFGDQCNPNVSLEKRKQLFLQLLETLPPSDAEVVAAAKDKKIPVKGIDAKLVNEAFPGLMPT